MADANTSMEAPEGSPAKNSLERFPEGDVGMSVAVPEGTGILDTIPWLVEEFDKAQRAREYWDKRLSEIKDALKLAAGDHETLLLGGEEVFTYSRIGTFRGAAFTKDHPDLAKVYERSHEVTELDVDLLKVGRPDLYREYQARQLRRKI